MATAKNKVVTKKTTTKKKPTRAKAKAATTEQGVTVRASRLSMKGDQLVVRLSRESHPEIFELDRLCKQVTKVIKACKGKRRAQDVVGFLDETQKGLQIILRNHLEVAMRKYWK